MVADETRLKRLSFRAWRRGFREADLILGPFTDQHARDMTPAQLDTLEHLLDAADQDIYDWILERCPAPPEYESDILNQIRAFRFKLNSGGGAGDGR
jgi:antitoxin CptB